MGLIYIHCQGMIHGDLKGVRSQSESWFYLTDLVSVKANILIDKTDQARLADFGLLTIISDPTNLMSSSSFLQGGTVRWMSPELIDPQRFGLENNRPTKHSDCYALGMVIYQTISGNLPFHQHGNFTVSLKVLQGERPPRGAEFTENLWKTLEMCWTSQPNNRPSIEGVLQCLEGLNLVEPPASVDGETEKECNDWESASDFSGTFSTSSFCCVWQSQRILWP